MPLYFPLRSAAAAADAGGAADWGPHQLAPHHPPACHLPLVLRTAHCVLHSPCSHRDGHPSPVLPRSGCLWSAACACVQGLIGPRPANVAWPPHYAMHLEPVAYHTQTDCRWNGCCWDDRRHQWRPPGAGLGAQEKGQRRCWPPHPWGRLGLCAGNCWEERWWGVRYSGAAAWLPQRCKQTRTDTGRACAPLPRRPRPQRLHLLLPPVGQLMLGLQLLLLVMVVLLLFLLPLAPLLWRRQAVAVFGLEV
mmetsp:Transcript_17086/g.47332  ORF Transcript_17086/g.47332 Transcript_17086/m.47332 type:complete len:249 (+) Transcript_17086:1051-1797(+)